MIPRWERRMRMADDKKQAERLIPGMNRRERFAEVEHAENAGAALRRIAAYFAREKALVMGMLGIAVPARPVLRRADGHRNRRRHALLLLAAGAAQPCHGAADPAGHENALRAGAQVLPKEAAAPGTGERYGGGDDLRLSHRGGLQPSGYDDRKVLRDLRCADPGGHPLRCVQRRDGGRS